MSSASRSGSYSGVTIAQSVTAIRRVAPSTAPAKASGEGIQPLSVPWCSSVCTVVTPCSSAYTDISTAAR